MEIWILVAVLILVELYVLGLIRRALALGTVSVNPASWFGYSEFAEIMVDRARLPAAYWFVLSMIALFALVLAMIAYLAVVSGGLPAAR